MVEKGKEVEEGKRFNTTPEETEKKVTKKMRNRGKKSIVKKTERLGELKIEYVAIDSITPNEYNPNRQSEHDFELLCQSMEEDGFTQPIICQQNGTIVDGEHRWRAAHALGYTEIPIVHVNMTQEQMRISTLRHNRARGSEDMDLSVQVLRDLQELGAIEWAQDSLMLSDDEVNKLLEDIPVPELMGSEEYTQAWEPSQTATPVEGEHTPSKVVESIAGSVSRDIRDKEEKLKEAKTFEERAQIRKESEYYRITLIFAKGDENIIKECLGENPANTILFMCREKEKEKEKYLNEQGKPLNIEDQKEVNGVE